MTTERELDKGISDIVGVFTDPIIVFPGGWGDSLPEWLKGAITLERLIENVRAIKGEEMTGTDAEACAYLMTVSLTQPIDSDWTQIYLYVATKVIEKQRVPPTTMPADIRVESLTRNQEDDLNRLKRWLYERRVKAKLERDLTERRERKGVEVARKEKLQPRMFDF